jgi:hypothetical protein
MRKFNCQAQSARNVKNPHSKFVGAAMREQQGARIRTARGDEERISAACVIQPRAIG